MVNNEIIKRNVKKRFLEENEQQINERSERYSGIVAGYLYAVWHSVRHETPEEDKPILLYGYYGVGRYEIGLASGLEEYRDKCGEYSAWAYAEDLVIGGVFF